MNLSGHYIFDHPIETVWQQLATPNQWPHILPGCNKVTHTGDSNSYQLQLHIPVGPFKGQVWAQLQLSQTTAPYAYEFQVETSGSAGQLHGRGHLQLHANGHQTTLDYQIQLHSPTASRLLHSSAKAFMRQSMERLQALLDARPLADPAPQPTTTHYRTQKIAMGTAVLMALYLLFRWRQNRPNLG